jgi:hypothetical protein
MTPREAALTYERKTVATLIAREVGTNGWIARSHPYAARLEDLVNLIGQERWRASVDRSTLPSFSDGTVWDPDELTLEMAS